MAAVKIAARPRDVDAAWLTAALRRSGALGEATVASVTSRPVGHGLIGDSFRFEVTYAGEPRGAPASLVGKFAAEDPVSKATGVSMGLYEREVSFYREMANTVKINTPHAYVAELDPQSGDFTLLFEDLTPARHGDQLSGCSLVDAETAILEAAALHGPRWGDPTLLELDWMNTRPAANATILDMLPGVIAGFRERYQDVLEPAHMALCEALPQIWPAFNAGQDGPQTIMHGDFRLDNILFDVQGGAKRMATLDWQTLGAGPGLVDVSYFLSASLAPDVRRAHEEALVRRYHAELLSFGVKDYDWSACWRDYRRYAAHGVFMGVFSAMVVERTPRGDQMFLAMTRGACAQALDHKTFDFWRG